MRMGAILAPGDPSCRRRHLLRQMRGASPSGSIAVGAWPHGFLRLAAEAPRPTKLHRLRLFRGRSPLKTGIGQSNAIAVLGQDSHSIRA